MSDPPPAAEKKRKGLVGFYVGTGVVVLLVVGLCFAWTPLRVGYWERKARKPLPAIRGGYPGYVEWKVELAQALAERSRAVGKLLQIGPRSSGAIARLVGHRDERICWAVLGSIEKAAGERPDAGTVNWTLPLVIAATDDPRVSVVIRAIRTAERLSGEGFFPPNRYIPEQTAPRARSLLLDWWEREGQARYGSGE